MPIAMDTADFTSAAAYEYDVRGTSHTRVACGVELRPARAIKGSRRSIELRRAATECDSSHGQAALGHRWPVT